MIINDLLSRLSGVHETSNGWQACCPAHPDRRASLCIHQEPDGKILMTCQAGCNIRDILSALHIKMRDLFPDEGENGSTMPEKSTELAERSTSRPNPETQDSKAGGRDVDSNKSSGKTSDKSSDPDKFRMFNRPIAATYDYVDENGKLIYQSIRTIDKDFYQRKREVTPTSAGWVNSIKNVRRLLYRLPNVIKAVQSNLPIYITEGEKDVHTLEAWGLIATTNSGGSNGEWPKSCNKHLVNASIIIIPDNDKPGMKHAMDVARILRDIAGEIKIIKLPGVGDKGDITDWKNQGHTAADLATLVESTEAYGIIDSDNTNTTGPDGELLNDLGNARRLVKKFGDRIKYCSDGGYWIVWDGTRWAKDKTGGLVRMASSIVDDMSEESNRLLDSASSDDDFRIARNYERHATQSGNHRRILAMISQSESTDGICVLAGDLDADPWLFNCANGTIDLRIGVLRPHNQANLITKISPVSFEPNATSPTWEKFISEVFQGDEELISFVQQAGGYTLTGDTREQVFFILYGLGSNGKSTLIEALREIMGDYQTKTQTDTLTEKRSPSSGPNNDIAALHGARFVSAIEANANRKLAESLVKELTGDDTVTARFLHKEFFEFKPQFKLWLACNHAPKIEGQDAGIWRRVRVIPFNVRFYRPEESATGPYRDGTLKDRLREEYSGVLSWLVQGCLDWQRYGLSSPESVMAATSEQRTTMDPLGGFFAEYCVINPKCQVQATELYQEYLKWSDATRERAMSQRWFGLRLAERGSFIKEQHRDGIYWIGIGLKSSFDESNMPENMQNVNDVNLVNLKKDSILREKKQNDISLFNTSTENQNYDSQGTQGTRHEGIDSENTPWWIEMGFDEEPEVF